MIAARTFLRVNSYDDQIEMNELVNYNSQVGLIVLFFPDACRARNSTSM